MMARTPSVANVMLTCVAISGFFLPSMAVRLDDDEESGTDASVVFPGWSSQPAWSPEYSACDAMCGKGNQTLIMSACMLGDKLVPDEDCEKLELERPAETIHGCEHNIGCEWKMAADADATSFNAGCGWARKVECVARGGNTPVPNEFCAKIIADSEADFLLQNGLATTGCDGTELQTLCVATFRSEASQEEVSETAKKLITRCGNADAIVISTQEMTQTRSMLFSDVFSNFATDLDPYVPVARCGGTISAGVVVLAQKAKQSLFAPELVHGECKTNDRAGNGRLAVGFLGMRSKQGSVMMEVRTVAGTWVAVSSHGPSGKDAVTNVADTVADVVSLTKKPAAVFWGGSFDFNLAPSQQEFADLASNGLTHPTNASHVDDRSDAKSKFNPAGYYDKLVSIPETFGGGSVAAFKTEVAEGALAEIEGVKQLCPPGPKADGPGAPEVKGYFNYSAVKWLPNFACQHQLPDSSVSEIDYYPNKIEGESHSITGWTDRLVVGKDMKQKCSSPQKIAATKGHDIVFSICTA